MSETYHSLFVQQLDDSGHRVRVGPGDPTASDVLEYAQLLIETEGWNQTETDYAPSNRESGWTLHDAIGEACKRLSARPSGGGGSKDAVYTSTEGSSVGLRTGAQDLVDDTLQDMAEAGDWDHTDGGDRIDYDYNDQASDVSEIIAVLQTARERA